MKLFYIIGPYRATSESGVRRNIETARAAAEELWRRGHAVICPHLNTAFMGGIVPDANFLRGDLLMLERADAALVLHDWPTSVGSRDEVKFAQERGIALYWSLGTVENAT
jgi:hypothetical protein